MTPSRLAKIKALADAATEGPWGYTYDGSGDYTVGLAKDPQGDGNTIASLYGPVETGTDAAFIAASRTAVPELVAEVERLTALLARPCCLDLAAKVDRLAADVKRLQLDVDSLDHGTVGPEKPQFVNRNGRTSW